MDLSHILSDPRVFISNECAECCSHIAEHYLSHDKIDILYLKNYGLIKPKDLILLSNMLFNTCKSKIADINSIKIISKAWVKNVINNILQAPEIKPFYAFDGLIGGGTALILAAGPSLSDNIEQIKQNYISIYYKLHEKQESDFENNNKKISNKINETNYVSKYDKVMKLLNVFN